MQDMERQLETMRSDAACRSDVPSGKAAPVMLQYRFVGGLRRPSSGAVRKLAERRLPGDTSGELATRQPKSEGH